MTSIINGNASEVVKEVVDGEIKDKEGEIIETEFATSNTEEDSLSNEKLGDRP